MRSNQHCKTAVMLTLQSAGPDLILLLALEVMLWTT